MNRCWAWGSKLQNYIVWAHLGTLITIAEVVGMKNLGAIWA